jgi:probable phosphoglycerate mutase
VRHGRTACNTRGIFSGVGSEGITPNQRSDLGHVRFDASSFDAVYCSPARRCRDTAECLGISDYIEEPRLAERHFGIFEGLSAEQCRALHPAEFDRFLALDEGFVIPGGESRAHHLERVLRWLIDVSTLRRVLAITHGGTIDFLYRLGAGIEVHGGSTVFAGPNAALSEFEVTWPRISVLRHGEPLAPAGPAVG